MMKVWVYCDVDWIPEIGTGRWKSEDLNSNMVHEKSGDKWWYVKFKIFQFPDEVKDLEIGQ